MPLTPEHKPGSDRQVAERQFVDRQEFVAPVQSALKEPPRTKPLVIVFHGGAGIGKSRLRRELVRQLARDPEVLAATLDFDVTSHRHPETALFFLRNTLCQTSQVCFPGFDLAYAVYWQKTHPDTALAVSGNSNSETRMTNEVSALMQERGSLIAQLLDESGKLPLIGIVPRISALVSERPKTEDGRPETEGRGSATSYLLPPNYYATWWRQRGERELEDIPQMEPGEIVDRLPKLWAADLKDYLGAASLKPQAPSREEGGERREDSQVRNDERRTTNEERSKRRAVLFIDSYEKLWDVGMAEADFFKRDEWLRELVTELPEVLWVVCGRQKLRWAEAEADWGSALSQHQLEPLPEKSARRFLESCDITDEPTQDAIVKGSRGVPHYLNLAADAVQNAEGKLQNANLAGGSPEGLVEEFTRQLDKPEVDTLSVLSAARFWYYGLFENLVTQYRTGYPLSGYDDLARFSFIKDGAAPGTRTMHELMREALQENQPPELRKSVHRFLYEYYAKQLDGMKESNITEHHRAALLEAFYHGRQGMNAEELWSALMGPTTVFCDAGQHRLLKPVYQEMTARLEAELGPSHVFVGKALTKLGCMVILQGEYEEAELLLRRALAIVEKERDTASWSFMECSNGLVRLLLAQDRLGEAEALSRREVEIFDKPGQTAIYRHTALNDLGVVLLAQGRLGECEEMLRRSLAVSEEEIGPDKYETAGALGNLSKLLTRRHRYAEAEPLARRALEIQEKNYGPDHIDVAWVLSALAVTVASLGRYAEAEPQFRRALRIEQEALGPDHHDTARTMSNLGSLLHYLGRYAESEAMTRQALAAFVKRLGPDHRSTLKATADLAIVLTKQSRIAEAGQVALAAVARCEEKLGPGDPVTAEALYAAGLARSRQGRHAEAEGFLLRAVEIDTSVHGAESPRALRSQDELAVLAERQGRHVEAESLLRNIVEKRGRVQGAEHPDLATTANRLAGICSQDGRHTEAETLYRRALAIREKAFGPDHVFVAETLEGLVNVCEQTGRTAEAQELAARAKTIREKNTAAAQASSPS